MKASEIKELLAVRHREDVFVPECKTGPSHSAGRGGMLKMDCWACKKAYRRPLSTCYEIKVSRSDFINDHKWPGYLPFCNAFYFVCPGGLISVEETPPDAGLMYVSKNCTRLYTKKKAPYRQVVLPEDLFKYILFSRSRVERVTRVQSTGIKPDREFWTRWLKEKELGWHFGRMVSQKIRRRVAEGITRVQQENTRLLSRMEEYDSIRQFLIDHGIVTAEQAAEGVYSWRVKQRLQRILSAFPADLKEKLMIARSTMDSILQRVQQIEGEVKPPSVKKAVGVQEETLF